jgi:DNA-binding transcriptional MerR regulator
MTERYSITDLAREFDITTRTIRFYEDEGLLTPERQGQTRIYRPRDRTRLRLILRGKRLGFSLKEIAEIIDLYDSEPGEIAQLSHFLEKIAERRSALARQREDIDIILAELDTVEAQCRSRLAAKTDGGGADGGGADGARAAAGGAQGRKAGISD